MRPLSIQMKGFGPYRLPQEIDFTQLEDLFVISGETGSGKTTIFDGLSYALYGKPLGTRSTEMIRCDKSTSDENTLVCLRFEVRSPSNEVQVWEVSRSPYFRKPNKKKTGFKAPSNFCELVQIEKNGTRRPYTGTTTKIDKYIEEELLHLSYDNFSKILILPQGEFQRFLEEQSKTRGEILEKLFPVEFHRILMKRVRDESLSIAGQIKEMKLSESNERCRILGDLPEEEVKALTLEQFEQAVRARRVQKQRAIDEAKKKEEKCQKAALQARKASQLGQVLQTKITQRDEAQKGFDILNGQSETIRDAEQELNQARLALRVTPKHTALKSLRDTKQETEAQKTRAESQHKDARVTEEELKPKHTALPGSRAQLEVIAVNLEKERQRKKRLDQLSEAKLAVINAQAELQVFSNDVTEKEALVTAASQQLEQLELAQKEKDAFNEKLESLRTRYGELKLLVSDAQKITQFEAEYRPKRDEEKVEEHGELTQRVHDHSTLYESLKVARDRLKANSAGRLALELLDGEPCPVCGSHKHPHPASQTQEGADLEDKVADLEVRVEAAQTKVSEYNTHIMKLETTFELQRKAADEAGESLSTHGFDGLEQFGQVLASSKDAFDKAKKHVQDLDSRLSQREVLRQSLTEARESIEQATKSQDQQKEILNTKKGVLAALEQELGEVLDVADALQKGAVEQNSLKSKQQELKELITTVTEGWEKVREELNTAKTKRDSCIERLEKLSEEIVIAKEELEGALNTDGFENVTAFLSAQRSTDEEKRLVDKIKKWNEERIRLEETLLNLNTEIGDQAPPDLVTIQEILKSAEGAYTTATEDRRTLENFLQQYDVDIAKQQKLYDNYLTAKHDVNGLLELHKKISGDNSRKVKFKDWVLGWWLDHVLLQANVRLEKLSEGRYTFVRRAENRKKSTIAGLDINVIDTHSSRSRDVRTLSGGEKFLAAISLAMGLADVIQMQSGGVRLDTLFIDEGFGTLSDEFRDLVLQSLSELRGRRQVGIISHVPEVKNHIPCRVEIIKEYSGSIVTIPR